MYFGMLNKQGEIWLANLNPSKGSEPGKTRPVLIVQGQALLDAGHPSTLIIPLTTNLIDDAEPLRIRVVAQGKLKQDSDLLIDQLRAIDNRCHERGSSIARRSATVSASPRAKPAAENLQYNQS